MTITEIPPAAYGGLCGKVERTYCIAPCGSARRSVSGGVGSYNRSHYLNDKSQTLEFWC